MCNNETTSGIKTHNIVDFFAGFKGNKVTCSVSSHPRCSYQLDPPYLSQLINYYHIILYEQNHKKQLDDSPQVCFVAILFVHEMREMEKTGYVSFLMRTFEIQRDTQFCSAIPTVLGQLRKLHICMILCLFITVAIGSLSVYVWMCMPACVLVGLHLKHVCIMCLYSLHGEDK